MLNLKPFIISIYLIFFFFFSSSSCQVIKNITLGQPIKGTMELDESHEYFLLTIPEGIENKVLVFTTKQENESNLPQDDDTLFSDPDFYVSKINKYPSSRLSSEWYSQRYGADIVTVPSGSVHGGDVFYIGMYCQFKCRYYLNSYVTIEITIAPGIGYVLNIKPNETGNLKLPIHNDFDELKVIIHFRQRGKIRVFMSKDMPSTQNSFNVVPSWIYGYSILIKKNTKEYCTNCDYHIFIKNEGPNTIYNLLIMPIFQKERFPLRSHLPLYDTMDKNTQRCYSFPVNQIEKEKEKLIIQITMYSGKIDILFEGWEPKNVDLGKNIEGKIENIMDENFFLFDKKKFDIYDKENENNKGKDSNFNFCVYSKTESSFIISSYFLSKLEHFQQFRDINILLPGNSMRGYLLKDQVFKYDLVGLNLDKVQHNIETNITVKLKNIAGKTDFYVYHCDNEKCLYNKNNLIKLLSNSSDLIMPIEENIYGESTIKINNKNNFCLKKENQLVPLSHNENINECMMIVLLLCNQTNDEGLCIYDIQLEIADEPILMKPRQMYYGVIPIKKYDTYEIIITDENVYNLVIVLNTESGDAELKIIKSKQNGPTIGWLSINNDYIPDVIRLTPSRIGEKNLVGKFIVKVHSKTFSTYHLYYYTTYQNENELEKSNSVSKLFNSEITMNLKIGEIVNDYFPIDIRYKLFSFNNLDKKENIKIFMNKVNIGFNIYVYKDITKFKILQIYEIIRNTNMESISGYTWKSNGNNEININTDDPEYSLNQNYYIVIAPNIQINYTKIKERQNERAQEDDPREYNFIETVARSAAIKFYLGVATESSPLMITEGIPHSMTLNSQYRGQLYYYIHFDLKKDFRIAINVFFGEIDIYIDINKIDIDQIKSLNDEENYDSNLGHYQLNSMYYYKNIKSYHEISLNRNYFLKYLPNEENAQIFFYIKRSKSYISYDNFKESQYTIIEKSSEQKEELLVPGETRTSVIPLGKSQHFIIEEVKKRNSGCINVFFKNGYGNVYACIPKTPEIENIKFPNEANYHYIGETIYSGKTIFIPKEVYDQLSTENFKIQILVTVVAETGARHTNSSSEVAFSINYSNEPKRINQNEPYDGYIKKGELQYFSLYFDLNTENIYIGLSNMKGDADMYLNYGETLPTSKKYHWNSNQINHEFIDISERDNFFKKNKVTISGFYTLLIVGYIDTSFTLFVSRHKNVIFPLRHNKIATCLCENEGDKCLFRYTDVFMNQNKENGINYNEVIFTSNYLYGSGIMYTKVVKDEEFHKIKNISKIFPDKDNYDISNKESKQRNYVKIQIKEEKYTEDSNVLMTFICSEKTKVDITSTSIRYFKTTDFIEENKENIYYLGFNPNSDELQSDITLFFYNYDKSKDLIYSIHSYVGDAQIIVYSNNSWWDVRKQKLVYDYQEINKFDINSYDEQNSLNGYNPYNTDYHNVILVKEKEKFDNIIFKIIPKNKFSFYIQCNYDKNFMEIPFGKMKSYFAKNNEFYGYFDITDEYSDIELSISVEKNLRMSAELYVKINIIDTTKANIRNSNDSILYAYTMPTEEKYDYKMITDKTLGTISLNMRNFPQLSDEEKKTKFIRGLFYIRINQKEFEPLPNEDDEIEKEKDYISNKDNKENEIKQIKNKNNDEKALINILLTPGINNFKQVKANPYVYYFSNLTYDSTTKERIPETKIWELRKDKIGHDIMIIEISSCSGEYSFKIQDHLITGVNNDVSVNYYDKHENGKHTIYVDNLRSSSYYLSIEARESDLACKMKNEGKTIINCGNDLAYIMYYYTDYEHSIKLPKISKFLTYSPYGKGKIKIEIPEIIMRDINDDEKDIKDFKFDVFATKKKEYFPNLGNVCFLSRFVPSENTVFYLEDMKISNKKALIISGLGYRNQYYIGVLIQNIYTRELIAFDPIVVWSGGYLPFSLWQTILTNVIIIGLIVAIIIYVRKYRTVKIEIKEIKGEALPKSEFEMPSIGMTQHISYSGIGESY